MICAGRRRTSSASPTAATWGGSTSGSATPGCPYFLEINALPSLEPGAGIYAAAELEGLHFDAVIGSVLQAAASRYGIKDSPRRQGKPTRKTGPLRVGFAYNVKRIKPSADAVEDSEAEYDSPSTLQAIREAIASWGHEVIDLEANQELPNVLAVTPLDLVFNIAEGFKGRNRESQVPALLELLDIPYTGSDPATLSIALDKAIAKRIVRQHGIHTPNFQIFTTGKERLNREFTEYPLDGEAGGRGLEQGRGQQERGEQRGRAARGGAGAGEQVPAAGPGGGVRRRPGVHRGARSASGGRACLPAMEIVFTDTGEVNPVYSFQHKLDWNDRIRYDVPAKLEPNQMEKLRTAARGAFMALGCRDVARIDFRMDARGRFFFLECNPLPGLTPGLERPGADRPGRGDGLPRAHRGDHERGDPPLQGARGAPRGGSGGGPARRSTATGTETASNGHAVAASPVTELREGKG